MVDIANENELEDLFGKLQLYFLRGHGIARMHISYRCGVDGVGSDCEQYLYASLDA